MGREVRRVPSDWQHPTDNAGRFVPLFDGVHFEAQAAAWDAEARKWAEGFRSDHNGRWVPLTDSEKVHPYSWWDGERPDPKNYMPVWRDDERTHLMMYEDVSEGTPKSPAFATAEELARWLEKNSVGVFAGEPASYEDWLAIIGDPQNSLLRIPMVT